MFKADLRKECLAPRVTAAWERKTVQRDSERQSRGYAELKVYSCILSAPDSA